MSLCLAVVEYRQKLVSKYRFHPYINIVKNKLDFKQKEASQLSW